jgi:hypothetical protein
MLGFYTIPTSTKSAGTVYISSGLQAVTHLPHTDWKEYFVIIFELLYIALISSPIYCTIFLPKKLFKYIDNVRSLVLS